MLLQMEKLAPVVNKRLRGIHKNAVNLRLLIKALEDLLLGIPGNSTTAVSYRYFNHPLLSPDSNLYILSFRCILKAFDSKLKTTFCIYTGRKGSKGYCQETAADD